MTPATNRPLNKISYGTTAGILAALALWALRRYAGIELDAEGAGLITTLVAVGVTGLVGYLTPLAPGEVVTKLTKAGRAHHS